MGPSRAFVSLRSSGHHDDNTAAELCNLSFRLADRL